MSTVDIESTTDTGTPRTTPTILRHGFRHPRGARDSSSDNCARTEPPEIKWKACSWDSIDDEREGGEAP